MSATYALARSDRGRGLPVTRQGSRYAEAWAQSLTLRGSVTAWDDANRPPAGRALDLTIRQVDAGYSAGAILAELELTPTADGRYRLTIHTSERVDVLQEARP